MFGRPTGVAILFLVLCAPLALADAELQTNTHLIENTDPCQSLGNGSYHCHAVFSMDIGNTSSKGQDLAAGKDMLISFENQAAQEKNVTFHTNFEIGTMQNYTENVTQWFWN